MGIDAYGTKYWQSFTSVGDNGGGLSPPTRTGSVAGTRSRRPPNGINRWSATQRTPRSR